MSNNFTSNIVRGIRQRANKIFTNTYSKAGFSWRKEIILKHLPEKGLHTTTLFGKPFTFLERNGFLHSVKEIFVDEVYRQILPADSYIIDCGANIGLSVIYIKRLCPSAKVVAFEPDEMNFSLLEQNIKSFGLTNVELRKEAIWTDNTVLEFSNNGTLGSKIVEGNVSNTIKVKATRLKDLLKHKIDFLKMDIEGAEYAVLKDVADALHLADKVFIEYHGTYSQNDQLNEILAIIVGKGFHYNIKEAYNNPNPFVTDKQIDGFDVQLNIFCKKTN